MAAALASFGIGSTSLYVVRRRSASLYVGVASASALSLENDRTP